MPVILATQEAEIRRISVQSQQFVRPYLEKPFTAQGVGPEFKPQYCKTNKQKPQSSKELLELIKDLAKLQDTKLI
jgi:hypothetical protein